MRFTAEVADGGGAARRWMPSRLRRIAGLRVVPGSLNVHLTHRATDPPEPSGTLEWFGETLPWHWARVNGLRCVAIGVTLIMPARHKVELLADRGLRDALGLVNGDVVLVELEG